MNDVKVCKRCRKLFNHYRNAYCYDCEDELERVFQTVRDYIYDHPRTNLADIVKNAEVKESDVLYLLRQGRISFDDPSCGGLPCEQCGKPIASGSICDACREGMARKFDEMASRDDALKPQPRPQSNRAGRSGLTSLDEIAKR